MSLGRFPLALLVGFTTFAAQAHKSSDSYLTLRVDDRVVQGRWDIALRDLDVAVGVDANQDGTITWGEVRAAQAAIDAYATQHLVVRSAGEPCAWTPARHLVEDHSDGAYAVLMMEGTCPRAGAVSVDYRALFDLDARHQGLAHIEANGIASTTTFTPRNPVQALGGLERAGGSVALGRFLLLGIEHIATGWDHLLFLAALLLPAVMVRRDGAWQPAGDARSVTLKVMGIVTAFTLAHSITLSAAVLQWVSVPSRLVESAIAASVVMAAVDNIVPFLPRRRWLLAFGFGLVHGLGFASALLDMALPRADLALALLGFNVGVEIGQLVAVAMVVPIAYQLRRTRAYPRVALTAGSAFIALIAMGWFVERAFLVSLWPA